MVNIRQAALNAKDVKTELVEIPEWGATVEVRGFTLGERLEFLQRVAPNGEVNRDHYLPELVIASVFDPDTGQKVFEPADRDMLKTKSAAAVDRITSVANRLSGIGEDEAQKVEQDLEETPTDGSL